MRSSLGIRLLIAASLSTFVALIATAFVLNILFRAYFEERIHSELESYLVQLTAHVNLDNDGTVRVSTIGDPRFSEPLSGYYWQVDVPDSEPIQSASFWLETLKISRPENRGEIVVDHVNTDLGDRLIAGSWVIVLDHDGIDVPVHLIAAIDRSVFENSITGFSRNVMMAMGVLGVFLILASWFQVHVGLRPLEKVRNEVHQVKEKAGSRLSDEHPSELMPLVSEVNDLLDHQQSTLQEARVRASNLAHGLKTPLTIMRALSRDLDRIDQHDISSEIDVQVDNMRHFVERELARTRDQLPKEATCLVAPVVERLMSAFQRKLSGSPIRWQLRLANDASCPFDEYALTELLGNLIDNASKWTRDKITISAGGDPLDGFISVADNGPGVKEEQLGEILQRGAKLDETVPGHGLGLAIVADMVSQRQARLLFAVSDPCGLTVTISWGNQEAVKKDQ